MRAHWGIVIRLGRKRYAIDITTSARPLPPELAQVKVLPKRPRKPTLEFRRAPPLSDFSGVGLSINVIARLLNERQIATRTGKGRWELSTVWGRSRLVSEEVFALASHCQ
jgi:hypothetical protein